MRTLLLGTIVGLAAWAQAPQNAHTDAAKRMAGTRWASAYDFFCVAPKANAATDPPIQPTKVFDNLYAIGDSGTTAYALTTTQGIILIDSLPANQTETVLLPGLKVNTSATNFYPLRSMRMAKFQGDHWELFGEVMTRSPGPTPAARQARCRPAVAFDRATAYFAPTYRATASSSASASQAAPSVICDELPAVTLP